jgi:hypothetical protein
MARAECIAARAAALLVLERYWVYPAGAAKKPRSKPTRMIPQSKMKQQPESSTQEVLAGLVERVTFHNVENGFCVLRAKARGHRELVTVVGHAAIISAGEWITATGGLGQ